MRWVVALLALVCAARLARADSGDVAIVTTGAPALHPHLAKHIDKWLRQRGRTVAASPLSNDAINTLANCFLLDDLKCARGVFDARSKASSLVFARIEAADKDVTIDIYWFVKGHDPIGERRVCENCTADTRISLTESMLGKLAGRAGRPMGKLELESRPSGLVVVLDTTEVGKTPLVREVPAGTHTVTLLQDGRTVGERDIEIVAGETRTMTIKADADDPTGSESRRSPWLGGTLLGVGAVAIATGVGFLYYGAKSGPDEKWLYPDATPTGIVLVAVGGGAALGGTFLLIRSGSDTSGPVASVRPGGAYVGWVGRF